MPKHPKPWLRKGRGWYIQRNGEQVFLSKEKAEALKQYHALMGKSAGRVKSGFVAELVDSFLEWVQQNRAPDTYRWYKDRLQLFCGLYPDLKVSALKPLHVQKWIDGMQVANGTKRNFARSIMRKRPGNPLAICERGPGPFWCGHRRKSGGIAGCRPDLTGCRGNGNAGGPGERTHPVDRRSVADISCHQDGLAEAALDSAATERRVSRRSRLRLATWRASSIRCTSTCSG